MSRTKMVNSTVVDGQPSAGRAGAFPEYELNAAKRLVSVKFRRKLTVTDIAKYAALLRADPLFEPDFSEVVEIREVEELDLNADEFIRLAGEIDPFSERAKRAFVVSNEIQNHAARMHKILRTQRSISIFHSLEAARRWVEA